MRYEVRAEQIQRLKEEYDVQNVWMVVIALSFFDGGLCQVIYVKIVL